MIAFDYDNLKNLSDAQLMSEFHSRMSKVYNLLHVQETGTKEERQVNVTTIIRVTAELDLIKVDIKRRECDPLEPDQIDVMINLDLN